MSPGLPTRQDDFPGGLGRTRQHLISERRSTLSLLSPFMLIPAHSAPLRGVRVTQQVAWNKVSHRKRSLTHRRAWAAKKILGEAFFLSAAASLGRGLTTPALQPTAHDSGPEVAGKERGQGTRCGVRTGSMRVPRLGEQSGSMNMIADNMCHSVTCDVYRAFVRARHGLRVLHAPSSPPDGCLHTSPPPVRKRKKQRHGVKVTGCCFLAPDCPGADEG